MQINYIEQLIHEYKNDYESVFHTWFINNNDRLKAFRTIKEGLRDVIQDIERHSFGNDYKGSSLEFVVTAISEQKQIFEGAAHAFFWKPKLRIPDIYENTQNQLAFGRFLKAVSQVTYEKQIIEEIIKLNNFKIKGLGPAVANILYFLHPTLFPPSNTAMVNGFNALFTKKIKLGSWIAYLEMREHIIEVNETYRSLLSKDLGAISGLLFEIGSGRLIISGNAEQFLEDESVKRNKSKLKRHQQVVEDLVEENEHSEIQFHLARLGQALGYKVWIAQNDHRREWSNKKLGEFSIPSLPLPSISKSIADTVALIDVIWLDSNDHIISAFEVEKSTSIYSGILRLHDLALSIDGLGGVEQQLYLVAPDKREKEVKAQLIRPSIQQTEQRINYILFSDLRCDCDAMCKYGSDVSVLDKISRI